MPLRVAWGTWHLREGIILKLEDPQSGVVGFGEIAPLESFGTESLETALRHIFALKREMPQHELEACIPEAPAAASFGLRSALNSLNESDLEPIPVHSSALVNMDSLEAKLDALRESGTSVFKLKVGIQPASEEQAHLDAIVAALNEDELLRLDPNQSWDLTTWDVWRPWLKNARKHIQFIEEPFDVESMTQEQLLKLSGKSPVPIALDESLSRTGTQPWIDAEWPGFWIIKPSLQGDPSAWLGSLNNSDKVILSSAFETGIGMSSIICLAQGFVQNAHGLGTHAWFDDEIGIPTQGCALSPLTKDKMESIWNNLPDD